MFERYVVYDTYDRLLYKMPETFTRRVKFSFINYISATLEHNDRIANLIQIIYVVYDTYDQLRYKMPDTFTEWTVSKR